MTQNKKFIFFMVTLLLATALVFTGCTNDTSYSGTMNIVEPSQVGSTYQTSDNVIVIDARGQEAYDKGHLKGAVCLSPSELVVSEPVNATLASKATLEAVLSEKGISNDTILYIYDDNGGVSAGRVWWTLKVYGHDNAMIINNGAKGLELEGLEMSLEVPNLPETSYAAKEANPAMIATFDDVLEASENLSGDVKLLDVRSSAEYDAGSIPGATLYPHTRNLYNDGTFKSARDTYLFYKDAGFERDDEIILYCKSSFRATQTLALLEEAGYENVRVYDGAWIEWEQNAMPTDQPVEKAPITSQDAS